jgi:hypothetical protein
MVVILKALYWSVFLNVSNFKCNPFRVTPFSAREQGCQIFHGATFPIGEKITKQPANIPQGHNNAKLV